MDVNKFGGCSQTGGAIQMGLSKYQGSGSCATAQQPPSTTVSILGRTTFIDNVAGLHGGAIGVESGRLSIKVSALQSPKIFINEIATHHTSMQCMHSPIHTVIILGNKWLVEV